MRNALWIAVLSVGASGCYLSWSPDGPADAPEPAAEPRPVRPAGAPAPWVIEVVDDSGLGGIRQSIVAHDDGAVSLSYARGDGIGWELAYASSAGGGGFSRGMIATGEELGEFSSIALGPAGAPAVAYIDGISGNLMLARRSGSAWSSEVVDDRGFSGYDCSLEIDAAGAMHVAYSDLEAGTVRYATDAGGAWTIETIASGDFPSLALGPEGEVVVSLLSHLSSSTVQLATRDAGEWRFDTVPGPVQPLFTSLGLDADGAAHLVYGDLGRLGESELWYATNASGAWTTELVDDDGDTGLEPELAVDPWGAVHVAYIRYIRGDLVVLDDRMLRYATNAGGAWQAETVDDTADTGYDPAIAIDPRGGIHIAYGEAPRDPAHPELWIEGQVLKVAHRAPPGG